MELIEQAKMIVRPFVSRRLEAGVLKDLPKKSEEIIKIEMSKSQSMLYHDSDGDFLIVPQLGTLIVTTEFGQLIVALNHLMVIQEGMKFSINSEDGFSRGYVLELKGKHFELPYLGVIGLPLMPIDRRAWSCSGTFRHLSQPGETQQSPHRNPSRSTRPPSHRLNGPSWRQPESGWLER